MQEIPYVVYESAEAKSERIIKKLITALVMAVILLFASNALWLYEWSQYDYTSEDTIYTQDGEGVNNINTGTQGDITNGAENDQEKAYED